MLHEKEMKAVYADTLIELMNENPHVLCLEADLGRATGTFPKVAQAHPSRFLQMGIAESNMIGVAAGLAVEGKVPFCASFAAFASRRVYDQITVSVAYANTNVKIVGTAAGATQAFNGGTHMCFQDLAIMRVMPNMTIYSPADVYELRSVIRTMAYENKPTYLQLVREKLPAVFSADYSFVPGKAVLMSHGADVTIVTTGLTTSIALAAVSDLLRAGIKAEHLHFPTVKPFDAAALVASAKKTGRVLSVENQSIIGGLGGAVCEVLSESFPVKVKRLGARDRFGEVGPLDYLVKTLGFSAEDIVSGVMDLIASR